MLTSTKTKLPVFKCYNFTLDVTGYLCCVGEPSLLMMCQRITGRRMGTKSFVLSKVMLSYSE